MDQTTDRFAEFSEFVTSVDEFREVIGHPKDMVKAKVIDHLSDICREFIASSPFILVGSSNEAGRCEVSPKGDPIGFVHVLDDKHLVIVRRQDFWDHWLRNLGESLAHLVGLIMRHAGDDASGALRVSYV